MRHLVFAVSQENVGLEWNELNFVSCEWTNANTNLVNEKYIF